MPDEAQQAEIERLGRLLAASQGQSGYADRAKAIEAKLKEFRDA